MLLESWCQEMTTAKECRMQCYTNDWAYGYEIKSSVALLEGEGGQSFQFGTGALSMLQTHGFHH